MKIISTCEIILIKINLLKYDIIKLNLFRYLANMQLICYYSYNTNPNIEFHKNLKKIKIFYYQNHMRILKRFLFLFLFHWLSIVNINC